MRSGLHLVFISQVDHLAVGFHTHLKGSQHGGKFSPHRPEFWHVSPLPPWLCQILSSTRYSRRHALHAGSDGRDTASFPWDGGMTRSCIGPWIVRTGSVP